MRRVREHPLSRWAVNLLLPIAIAGGCSEEPPERATPPQPSKPAAGSEPAAEAPPPEPPPSPELSHEELVAQGERVYNVNCIACHHRDPTQDGGLGPAIAGASEELLEARVIHGTYPPGYTPERDTRLMIPLPHLAPDIPALAAYLAQAGNGQ